MKHSATRRTTLTLPTASLDIAERIALERHLNLSAVVAEALQRGLQEEGIAKRSEAILQGYSKAFEGFSADELLLLDGVVMEDGRVHSSEENPIAPKSGRRRRN